MLDIVLFRTDQGGDPDIVRESQRRRYADVTLVDKVIEYDGEWRQSELAIELACEPVLFFRARLPRRKCVRIVRSSRQPRSRQQGRQHDQEVDWRIHEEEGEAATRNV